MNRRKKIIIAIIIVILIGLITIIAGVLFINTGGNLASGNGNILVCAIDESEPRPGMGACDMAFIVKIQNGEIKNYTAVYPHGMTHPNASEPAEAQAQGAGPKLLLHDAFWSSDNEKSMKLAKEIVEYQTRTPIDAVVATIGSDEIINKCIKDFENLLQEAKDFDPDDDGRYDFDW